MSEPQPPNPTEQPEGSITPDPLLKSGSFIDADQNDAGEVSPEQQQPSEETPMEFTPGTVIAAQPISMLAPGGEEGSPETAAPRTARRSMEEMSKRPSWLPEDWTIDCRVRTSGATAGLIDRYYVEPSEQKRKFRSKNEVLHFLQTGSKLKKKAGDTEASVSQKAEKSSGKRKKPEASNSDGPQKKSSTKGKKSEAINSEGPQKKSSKKSEALNSDSPQKKSSAKGKKSEALNSGGSQKKSSAKGKKSKALNSDSPQKKSSEKSEASNPDSPLQPEVSDSVQADTPQEI